MSDKIYFSKKQFEIRDKIIKHLDTVQLLSMYKVFSGDLHLSDKDLGVECQLNEFDQILSSIFRFEKIENQWKFKFDKITVHFSLKS